MHILLQKKVDGNKRTGAAGEQMTEADNLILDIVGRHSPLVKGIAADNEGEEMPLPVFKHARTTDDGRQVSSATPSAVKQELVSACVRTRTCRHLQKLSAPPAFKHARVTDVSRQTSSPSAPPSAVQPGLVSACARTRKCRQLQKLSATCGAFIETITPKQAASAPSRPPFHKPKKPYFDRVFNSDPTGNEAKKRLMKAEYCKRQLEVREWVQRPM
jgi:hypothetical protein